VRKTEHKIIMISIKMEDIRTLKRKTNDSGGSNISLYVGATAFLLSLATAILLYREITKVKNGMIDMKQMKNQLMNIDSRFDEMDEKLRKVLNNSSVNKPHFIQKKDEVDIKTLNENEIEGEEELSDDEESSDEEIDYEEENSDEED
jgi:hypothetical protein